MRRHTVTLAFVGLAFIVGFVAGREAPVEAQAAGRVLEIRTYVTPDQTGLKNLVTRMRDESKIFDRLGMKSVAYFVAAEAPKSENTFVYILAHESREKAKESWAAFGKDPEWLKLRADAASPGQMKIESVFVTPLDFSPLK